MSGRGKGSKPLRKKSTSQVTIHSKSHGTPPPEWLIDFPTKNVSDKIEIHKKAIGEKEKPEEMNQEDVDEEKLKEAKEKREIEANEILQKVMARPIPKKIRKRKPKSSNLEKLILDMGKTINKNLVEAKTELKSTKKELETKQDNQIKGIKEKVQLIENKLASNDQKLDDAIDNVNKTADEMKKTANDKILEMTRIVETFHVY